MLQESDQPILVYHVEELADVGVHDEADLPTLNHLGQSVERIMLRHAPAETRS